MAQTHPDDTRDLRGTLGALIFIVVGLICWWDISDAPSAQAVVFPRTVIGLMVAFSVLLIVRNLLGFATPEERGLPGSVPRRVGLLVAMIAGTLAMPWIGFVLAGIVTYLAIMAVAMYEQWTWARRLLYPASGVAIVLAFYLIFQKFFLVPLPEARWFTLPF